MSFTSILKPEFQPSTVVRTVLEDVPMGLPLSEELDLLAELGDVSW